MPARLLKRLLIAALGIAPSASDARPLGAVHLATGPKGKLAVIQGLGDEIATKEWNLPLSNDSTLRPFNKLLYFLNRGAYADYSANKPSTPWPDHLLILDPIKRKTLATISMMDAPPRPTHPEDLWVTAPNQAFVTLLKRPVIQVIDPSKARKKGATPLEEVLIKTLDSTPILEAWQPNGFWGLGRLTYHQYRLYIGVDRVFYDGKRYGPKGTSALLVIDTQKAAFVDMNPKKPGTQMLELPGEICSPRFVQGNDLMVTCSGDSYDLPKGMTPAPNKITDGLYAVDLKSMKPRLLLSNVTAGRRIYDAFLAPEGRVMVLLMDQASRDIQVRPLEQNGKPGNLVTEGEILGCGDAGGKEIWCSARRSPNGPGLLRVTASGESLPPLPFSRPPGRMLIWP